MKCQRGKIALVWEPDECVVDVAYYQSDTLKGKWTGAHSGDEFEIAPPPSGTTSIATELKI